MRRLLLALTLAACGSPATAPPSSTPPAPPPASAAPPAAQSPFIGRWVGGSLDTRAYRLELSVDAQTPSGALDILGENAGGCALAPSAAAPDATHLPMRWTCTGPDQEDASDPPQWEGETSLALSSHDALTADFGSGPVTLTRLVFPPPPTDGRGVSLEPFLGSYYGVALSPTSR